MMNTDMARKSVVENLTAAANGPLPYSLRNTPVPTPTGRAIAQVMTINSSVAIM